METLLLCGFKPFLCGTPNWTRTNGTQFRKLLLYPPELWAHIGTLTILLDISNFVKMNDRSIQNIAQVFINSWANLKTKS